MLKPLLLAVLLIFLTYILWPVKAYEPVAHAGGAYKGLAYTNSLQALDENYAKGFRLFEIDFLTTSDGKLICRHDWNGFDAKNLPPAYVEIENYNKDLHYTPCNAESVIEWFALHKDAKLITDTKQANREDVLKPLAESKIAKQVVPQIYSPQEYEAAQLLGFDDVILTLYLYGGSDAELKDFLKTHKIFALTMPSEHVFKGRARKLQGNYPIYAHTINDCMQIFVLRMLGANGVYTDSISPDSCGF